MTSPNINDYATLNKYALLAYSGITTAHTTIITNGDYGSYPTQTYGAGLQGTLNNADANVANTEIQNLENAINAYTAGLTLSVLPVTITSATTFYKNIKYYSGSSITFQGIPITLDAQGDTNAQFFITASASITFDNVPSITLLNGASTCNVFWLAGTALISFTGTSPPQIPGIFIAGTAITFAIGSNVVGRLYAQTANVTFDGTGTSSVNGICTTRPQDIICYLKGTLILTKQGFVPIENIKAGHDVVTKGKIYKQQYVDKDASLELTPVIWISKFKVLKLNSKSRPICITKNALGKNLPFKNLYVSPDHSLLLNGTMVNAKHMVNGTTIYQDEELESVEYYHLECKNHRAIFANGILSETYLEGLNNRDVFDYSVKLRPKFNFKKIHALR